MPSLPVFALLLNAFVWGLSWWPFRVLLAAGVHPLWSTFILYGLAMTGLLALRPGAWRGFAGYPVLWLLLLSTGLTNVGFNWAVTVGDVVRVVLLFYLMPAWAVLLAWLILGERPTRGALLRLVLAAVGLGIVLVPPEVSLAAADWHLGLADGLALMGGWMFALTNVLLKRLSAAPWPSRMLAMLGGGGLLAGLAGLAGFATGVVPALPPVAPGWAAVAVGLSMAFLVGNMALQYGASRLAAGTTAIVMLTEVVFASTSSVLLGAATLTPRTLVGGALIVAAALLAAWQERR